ncbi:hypothetical protein Hdeb2414_s0157g00817191 [Helianthus debilis subsp. tardiflorus]
MVMKMIVTNRYQNYVGGGYRCFLSDLSIYDYSTLNHNQMIWIRYVSASLKCEGFLYNDVYLYSNLVVSFSSSICISYFLILLFLIRISRINVNCRLHRDELIMLNDTVTKLPRHI